MEITDREEVFVSFLHPLLLFELLAFGAVTVPAGIVRDPQVTAPVAFLNVASQFSRSAGLDGSHGTMLAQRHVLPAGLPIRLSMGPENVGDFKTLTHGKPPSNRVEARRATPKDR